MHVRDIQFLEDVVKGFANKRRITILRLLARQPNLDVELISERLKISYTSTAAHLQKMHDAGLIDKEEDGYFVIHRLTARGKKVYLFLCRLE